MAKSYKDKIRITGYDELFGGSSGGICDTQIKEIPLSELHSFKNHPFKVKDDGDMVRLAESIAEHGVLVPAMARPREDGGYELVSGHRRKRAAEMAGLRCMPVIVAELDDDEAVLSMVDANLQRETVLPSEKAYSYKMKLEALKHQGKKGGDAYNPTSGPGEQKLCTRDIVAKDAGESAAQVRRYIRLTELTEELLDMVDEGMVSLKPAVEISYLNRNEQKAFLSVLKELGRKPNLSQAVRIRNLSRDKHCTKDAIYAILHEDGNRARKFVIDPKRLTEYFPENASDEEIEQTIFRLLDKWREGAKI